MEGIDTTPGVYPGLTPTYSGVPKVRKYLTMGQFICGQTITTHNNTIANLSRGVGERVLFTDKTCTPTIQPVTGVFERRCGIFRDRMVDWLGRQSPVSRQQFVEFYKGPRRALYQRACDGLALRPVRLPDSYLSTFVKAEKINLSLKPDPAPRVIQPRNPRYNVEVGRFLLPLEHKVYDAIDWLFGSPTIMSKYNSVQQAEIIVKKMNQFHQPVCVGLDASRFDQHVSVQALKFEHTFYHKLFPTYYKFHKLLTWQLNNVGFANGSDGSFRYVKAGSRMSGDMNTSLGNKFLMCLMAKSYLDTKHFEVEFVNNGDDCLMIFESRNLKFLSDLESYFKDFGFKIVREAPVYEIEHIEFCQCKPLLCNGIWRMVRNVKTALLKDVTSVNLGHDIGAYQRWLKDVSMCGMAFAGDVPVFGEFYKMLRRFGKEGSINANINTEFDSHHTLSRNCHIPHSTPDDVGRYSFWKQTGIHPDAQEQLENYFAQAVWGGDKRQLVYNYSTLITDGS